MAEPPSAPAPPRPLYAVWEVTLGCTLRCTHCASRGGLPRQRELSTAECLDVIRQLAALGVQEVTLIGGEAYARPDWLELLSVLRDHGVLPTLTTSGFGLSPAMARAAARAGLAHASVSIDGEPATHDRLRARPGSHAQALQALAALRDAGVRVGVNTQLHRASQAELPALLERIAEAGAQAWQVQLTVPMGRAVEHPELVLQPFDLLTLFPVLGALAQRCAALGVALSPGNNVGYFGPFEAQLRSGAAHQHGGSCGAGVLTLGLESDGTVKGCPSLATATWAAGNVRDTPLATLWAQSAALQFNREATPAHLWGFCATCYYAAECRGGCTWTASTLLGRPGNNPLCHHRALELERQGLRERLVLHEGAPGTPFDTGLWALRCEPLP